MGPRSTGEGYRRYLSGLRAAPRCRATSSLKVEDSEDFHSNSNDSVGNEIKASFKNVEGS